jgi:hypothetical protein
MIRRVIALAAAAGCVPVLAMAGTASAHIVPNSTPSCGATCNNLFNERYGPGLVQAAMPDWSGDPFTADAGDPVRLAFVSNTDPNQDFVATQVGVLDDFTDGRHPIISRTSYVNIHYGDDFPVFENTYQPFGVDSGLCIGVARNAFNGEAVTLQDCGDTARTLWVGDIDNADLGDPGGFDFIPWVQASDANFSHALVLTENGQTGPLSVTELNKFSDGTVSDRQQWGIDFGPEPQPLTPN